ncbi:hypothetical protein [Caulobacter sp. S45]|uniref:hypothetical protein n=1 Tax=Caulobacter sp. S45 TaxID=1641861 RepID=UPI00157614D3|nr:hypothetical protein [Caulobacter sp. S45]
MQSIAMKKACCGAMMAAVTLTLPALASAQTIGQPLVTSGNMPVESRVAGVAVGNGVVQSQALVNTFQSGKTPLVGVGALSGNPTHSGSIASVSVLNTTRLLGVSAGPVGSNGVNVFNPSGKPVLSGLAPH